LNHPKNIAEGIFLELLNDRGISVLKWINESSEMQQYYKNVAHHVVQFHFGVKGQGQFSYNDGSYQLPMLEDHSLLLYNPNQDLPIALQLNPKSWGISLLISIQALHELFSSEANHIPFLSKENKQRRYYKDETISPSMAIVLNQMLQGSFHPMVQSLYLKAKTLELLSLYFTPQQRDVEKCPFLVDEENMTKIKMAKDIIISRMAEPPTLQELSKEVALPINKLKEGFKEVYGEPVFSFLFDYKMERARQLLISGSHNVNEVGLKIGYSTASHFIAAFKKKYGITPKKFIMESFSS